MFQEPCARNNGQASRNAFEPFSLNTRLHTALKRYEEIVTHQLFPKHIAVFGRHSNFESEPTDSEVEEATQLLKNLPTVVVMTPLEFNLDYYVESFTEDDVRIFGWTNKNHPIAKDQIFLNSIYINEYGTAARTIAILIITLLHETVHWAGGKLKGTSPTHPFAKDRRVTSKTDSSEESLPARDSW